MSANWIVASLGISRLVVAGFVRNLFLGKHSVTLMRLGSMVWLLPVALWITHAHATMEEVAHLRVELAGLDIRAPVLEVSHIQRTVA